MKAHTWLWVGLLALTSIFAPAAKSAPQHSASGTAATLKINIGKDAIKPTAAQIAAIRRAAAEDIKEFMHPDQVGYSVALADLNDDGRPDLIVQYDDMAFCGSSGCSGVIVMAAPHGYANTTIDLPNFYAGINVLAGKHHGMHDLQYDDNSPVWTWDGKQYDVAKADLPGSSAPAWETRQAVGHPMMAVATPIDSAIKNLLVFCEQGTPVLAMVMKTRPSTGPVTLTFVFRGWAVSLPMQPNTQDPRLWVANLSRSDLPEWLAHRGSTSTTRELARLADTSYLRINGALEGQVSLQNSTAATQAALANCHHY